MRIVLADDHHLVRVGLRRVLEGFVGCQVVAEADDGDQVAALVQQHRPDVVVTDLTMRRRGGEDVIRDLHQHFPNLPVIVVSIHADAQHVRSAMDAGARGYVLKEAAPSELELALTAAAAGQVFMSPRVLAGQISGKAAPRFTPRQQEILRLTGQGLATKEIAAQLNLSVKTVETHRARMIRTLGLRRASEFVRYAILNTTPGAGAAR